MSNRLGPQFFEAGTHGQRFDKVKAMSNYQKGTLGQVGDKPGLGRKLMGTPSARQAAANRGLKPHGTGSADDPIGVLDDAIGGTPWGKAMNLSPARPPGKGPQGRHGPWSKPEPIGWARKHPEREVGVKPAAPRTNEQPT